MRKAIDSHSTLLAEGPGTADDLEDMVGDWFGFENKPDVVEYQRNEVEREIQDEVIVNEVGRAHPIELNEEQEETDKDGTPSTTTIRKQEFLELMDNLELFAYRMKTDKHLHKFEVLLKDTVFMLRTGRQREENDDPALKRRKRRATEITAFFQPPESHQKAIRKPLGHQKVA